MMSKNYIFWLAKNKTMTFNQFELQKLWDEYGLGPDYHERIELISSILPRDVTSIIDIGCGKAEVLAELVAQSQIETAIGVDASVVPLKSAPNISPVVAALPALPFPSACVDLVMNLQVLEHIVSEEYCGSLLELERIAKTYLLIGVPYKESLAKKQSVCAGCGSVSHSDGHVRSYSDFDLENIFVEFSLMRTYHIGIIQSRKPAFISWIEHHILGLWYISEHFVCPVCVGCGDLKKTAHPNYFVRFSVAVMNRIIAPFTPKLPYWIIGLYRRKDGF